MKKKINSFIVVLVMLAMNVFAQGNSSDLITEARTSSPYHFISIKGDMNVKIVQDDMPGVTVRGNLYQIDNTITALRNDTLFVYQTNTRKHDSKVLLTINVENISLLEASGNTKVDCTGLINTDLLTIRAYNGAQIKVDVRALKVDSKVTGCSTIDLSGIAASNAESIDGCGSIDSHLLDVMDQRNSQEKSCTGC